MEKGRADVSGVSYFARRPAVPAAASFAIGIGLHRWAPHVPWLWLGLLGALLTCAWATRRRDGSSLVILAALLVSGLVAAQLSAFYYSRNHVSAFAADAPRLARLELHIDQPPRTLTAPFSANHHPAPPKQVTTATVVAVETWDGWRPVDGQVLVQISDPHPRLEINQTVRVLGMLQRPAAAMNPGQFDWAKYYREQRILASVQVSHANNIEILASPGLGPLDSLRQSARDLLAMGFPERKGIDHALLRALVLGDGDPQLRDVQEQFKRTGTSHHLSISGMHVAVLGAFVFGVCRLLCLSPRVSAWAMILFAILYGAVALPSPPVVRSVILCAAFGFGIVSRRSTDALQLLALSVFAMLVYHPLDLYNSGFQLSFGTVLGLILFTRPMLRGLRRDPDMVPLPASRSKPSLLATATSSLDRVLIDALAAGIVAWSVSMPLIAFHFEQLNPWAILAGIALAPVVMVSLIGGLLKILLSLLWPGLSPAWAWLAAIPVSWMRHMVDWFAMLPWGDVPVPAPPLWLLLAFYVLLLPMLWPCHRAGLRWCMRSGRVALLGAMLFLPFQVGFTSHLPGAGQTRVTLLSVGAGQCAVIEPPSGRTVLVDAGSTGMTELVARCVGPFLRERRCTSLDTVMISHANYDHFSAVAELAEGYGVREVLTSSRFLEHAPGNVAAETMVRSLADAHRPPRELARGERIPLGRDTYVDVLWPPRDLPLSVDANDASLVVKLTHAGGAVLFTGDIQDGAMAELLKTPEQLRADVLVAPHHGSSERLTDKFVRAVAPRHILSSNDRSLSAKQRQFDRLVAGQSLSLLRTSRCGSITVTLKPNGSVDVSPYLNPRP